MHEEKRTSQKPAHTSNPGDPGPGTPVRKGSHARLDRLETLLLDRMAGIASSIAELRTGGGAATDLANQCHTLSARLSLLEDNFARMCNVVGRLDQEVQALKSEAASHKR